MKVEPLEIHDTLFLITRLIGQAPTKTVVREFFMNAMENAAQAPARNRRVRIYATMIGGVPKITFWNTGPGMNDIELMTATNLSASINKEMSLDANFGIGAKVSGLAVSPAGIRYRSCKDGVVHQLTIGYDSAARMYGRFTMRLPDGRNHTVIDVTAIVRAEGVPTDFDWTEVVLMGEDEAHNTVAEPLGRGVKLDRSYIATTIYQRFHTFLPGVEVQIETTMTKGGGKADRGRFRTLKPWSRVIDKLKSDRVRCPETGVVVQFIHDPKGDDGHSLSAKANPATQSTPFCALVHKEERYDFLSRNKWSAAAPSFGIPFGSKVLSVEIILPDQSALPNQYRDGLTRRDNRAAIKAEDYAGIVRRLMPDWVRDVIRDAHPPSDDNLDDLQRDLQNLLDEYRIPARVLVPSKREGAVRTAVNDDGDPGVENSDVDIVHERRTDVGVVSERSGGGTRASGERVIRAPEGAQMSKAAKALERAPKIEILDDPEEIAAKEMSGRAGRFYRETGTLFVNARYSSVHRMAKELEKSFAGRGEAETVRQAILTAAQRFTAFRVGKTVCYALAKRLADDWTTEDLDRATTRESLSVAADDYRQGLSAARRWVETRLRVHEALDPGSAHAA